MVLPYFIIRLSRQVEDGVTMWSFTCWREGEIERNSELRAARALKELEGWPEEVRCDMPRSSLVFYRTITVKLYYAIKTVLHYEYYIAKN